MTCHEDILYFTPESYSGIDQNVPRGNLSETFLKARGLTQALTNNNLLLKGASSTCSTTVQWRFFV